MASLDLDSELLTPPETTLDEMAEWASEIAQCVTEAVAAAEFATYNGWHEKTPSKSITWGHVLAEEAGFEPAVGINLRTLSRRVT